jgi:TolB protein
VLAVGAAVALAEDGNGDRRPARSVSFPGKPGGIAFARAGRLRGIYVTDQSGATPRRITTGYDISPAWSPDGRTIAFARGDRTLFEADGSEATEAIYVANADGTGLRQVLKSAAPGSAEGMRELIFPEWAPDGARLAFHYTDGIGVVNLDGTDARPLLPDRGDHEFREAAWSPEGTRLAYTENEVTRGLSVFDMTGGPPRRITRRCNSTPEWSPDGRRIACLRLSLRRNNAIHVVDVASGAARRLTNRVPFTRAAYSPSWSADGLQIVFGKFKLTRRKVRSDIYLMNADGTHKRRLIRNAFIPDWGRQP